MNWKKIAGITIGTAVVALLVFKLKSNKELTESKVYQYDVETPVNIKADTLHMGIASSAAHFTGQFEPFKESRLSAEQPGKINKIWVDVGSYVKKGQNLIALDNALLRLQLQSIEVQIESLEKDVSRYKILAQADAVQGVQLEKATLGLKSAKVQKATLLEQISKTTVKAPFDGIITAKLSEEGAFAAPGVPLLQLTDIAQLKFTIYVSENDLGLFRSKPTCDISIDALPGISMKGMVTMIGSKANAGNSFTVQFLVKNTYNLEIKSGMFGKAHINKAGSRPEMVIPASAMTGTSGRPQVYLVKGGKAVLHDIVVSRRTGNKAVVSEGLTEGDVLVTSGFINLFEGANVKIQ